MNKTTCRASRKVILFPQTRQNSKIGAGNSVKTKTRPLFYLPLSDAREEKPLVVEMLSSSCCERLSLISLTKEKPVVKGPGAEEMEG